MLLMYSRGIVPPTILSTNWYPPPISAGSIVMTACPYWPLPPVWRTKRPLPSAARRIVSRYETDGRPTFAATLNSRTMRSTSTSRWSSPIPAMRVWPDSSSVWTRKVGSSSARRWSAIPSLSWSALVFGSIATSMTGSGNVIDSRTIGWSGSVSESPVKVFLRPTAAAMSPA